MKKTPQAMKPVRGNCLRRGQALPIIPRFSETKRFPVDAFLGVPEAENSNLEFERGEMGMNATRRLTGLAIVAALCLVLGNGLNANAPAPPANQDPRAPQAPHFTPPQLHPQQTPPST